MSDSQNFYNGIQEGLSEQMEQEKCAEALMEGITVGMEPSPVEKLANLLRPEVAEVEETEKVAEEVQEEPSLSDRLRAFAQEQK